MLLSIAGRSQNVETLKPTAISKLIPSKIKGYSVRGNSKSSILIIGSLRYSISEKVFSSHEKTIKILLFDYVEAPIMFNQSVKRWQELQEVQTDSISFSGIKNNYGQVWESEHRYSKRSKLLVSVNNRFFLTIEAENVLLEELREFFKNFDLEKFPK
jgi:hypothetical protein